MLTSKKLIALAKKQVLKDYGIDTTYRTAIVLECSRTAIDRWEEGRCMDDECALKIADYLKLDSDFVLASIAAERNKDNPAGQQWASIADRLKVAGFTALTLLAALATTLSETGLPLA